MDAHFPGLPDIFLATTLPSYSLPCYLPHPPLLHLIDLHFYRRKLLVLLLHTVVVSLCLVQNVVIVG